MNETSNPASTRSFARVEQRLPVRIRILEAGEAASLAKRLAQEPTYCEKALADPPRRSRPGGTWEQSALTMILERLENVERLVERIASKLDVDSSEGRGWIEGETVSVSGGGLGIWAPVRLPDDTLLEIELTLLGDPTAMVRALGRVAWIVHPDGDNLPVGRFRLGVAFEAINPEDQEAVVRHTFRAQRAMLRERVRTESD